MKSLAYLTLVFSAVHAGLLRERQTCPQVCAASQCPAPPHACYYGQVKDICGCCVVCVAGEGEACGKRSSGHLSCGNELRCDSGPGKAGGFHSLCVCASSGPVCRDGSRRVAWGGNDGRTYPSICRLRTENRRAELGETSPVFLIQRGRCDSARKAKQKLFGEERIMAAEERMPVVEKRGKTTSVVWKHYGFAQSDMDQVDIVCKLCYGGPLPVLRLSQSSDLRPGEFVVAVGSPFSLQNTVTTGIVSTANRNSLELGFKDSDMDYIRTDAIINYGNSGGPLVNLDGDVIGINTLKVAAGISFAIPVDRIRQFLADSYNRQASGNSLPKKKFIGVRMVQLIPSLIRDLKEREPEFPDVSSGVYIYEVIPGTAASRGGMSDHDVIIGINGQPVHTTQEVSDAIRHSTSLFVLVRRKDGDVTLMIIPEETD
ncbi:hypothetical protein ACER0C_022211 [Sarotherodon galilaeus]